MARGWWRTLTALEARCRPGEQHVDADVGRVVGRERVPELGAKGPEGACLTGDRCAHRGLEGELRDLGGDIAPQPVLLHGRRAVDDVGFRSEAREKLRDLLRRVLQVVVERDRQLVARPADAAEKRIVLAVVAHQAHALDPRVSLREVLDHRPGAVGAAVVDEDQLELGRRALEHRLELAHQLRQ